LFYIHFFVKQGQKLNAENYVVACYQIVDSNQHLFLPKIIKTTRLQKRHRKKNKTLPLNQQLFVKKYVIFLKQGQKLNAENYVAGCYQIVDSNQHLFLPKI
jgi:hypothetical protein